MSKLTVAPPSQEILGSELRYNPNCPCLAECATHGFCSVCLQHHDRYSDHPPLCMRTEALKREQKQVHWHPEKDNYAEA